MLSYILLQCSWAQSWPTALALCLLPFLLGWLAAMTWYNVGGLRTKIAHLTEDNGQLNTKVTNLTGETTDLRVRLTQADSEVHTQNEQIRKLKNDLIICEGERNAALGKAGAKPGGAKQASSITFAGKKYKMDDLKIVEGIGPKIEELLHNAGIKTWKQLSETDPARINEILDAAGPNYNIHDPGTWPKQAALADAGKWDTLKQLQDDLTAGKV